MGERGRSERGGAAGVVEMRNDLCLTSTAIFGRWQWWRGGEGGGWCSGGQWVCAMLMMTDVLQLDVLTGPKATCH